MIRTGHVEQLQSQGRIKFFSDGGFLPCTKEMLIRVPHNRDVDGARRDVERAVEKLTTINLPGTVQISGVEKRWNGKTLEFSLYAAVGPFRSSIRGLAIVTDQDITIEIDLPKLLTAVVPERAFEASVRGLLDS